MKIIGNDQENVTLLTELSAGVCEFMKTFRSVFRQYLIGERQRRPFYSPDIC